MNLCRIFSYRSKLSGFDVLVVGLVFALGFGILSGKAYGKREHIIESVTESVKEARGREFVKSKGGPECNELMEVSSPTRAGKTAFKHWVSQCGERSELAMARTEIGGTYWYGWSMFIPADYDHREHYTIVMQLATWPSPRNGEFPCSGNGHKISITDSGNLRYDLQRAGKTQDSVCEKFQLGDLVKGKWTDFVMHAKWTGDEDGFLKLWMRIGKEKYEHKIDHKGRTWWNDEDKGPYFKMGAYMGDPKWGGPESRTVYTDEYRLGDTEADFDDVAPGESAN